MDSAPRKPTSPPAAAAVEPPADDGLAGALGELVERLEAAPAAAPPPPVPPETPAPSVEPLVSPLNQAVETFLDSARPAPPRAAAGARLYGVGEVGLLLALFAATTLALGSEGLMTWARRMEVGPVQDGWLAVLGPVYRAADAVGLTAPRRAAASASTRAAQLLGAGQDPLFAEAWKKIGELPIEPLETELGDWPELGPDLGEAVPAGPTGERTVLVIGDSMMAGSLGAALETALARDPRLRVVRAHQIGTGLSRPELFDWMSVITPLLAREKPALVVCSLGANDGQRIRHQGRQLAFGDPEWNAVYRKRVRALMQVLAGSDTRVLWLGLPPMRSEGFSRRVRYLNRIFAATARRQPRVDYMELGMLLTGADDDFATFIRDSDGRLLRVRMEDGVHYSAAGARLVSRWVVDWVYEQIGRVRRVRSG